MIVFTLKKIDALVLFILFLYFILLQFIYQPTVNLIALSAAVRNENMCHF